MAEILNVAYAAGVLLATRLVTRLDEMGDKVAAERSWLRAA